MIHEMMIDDSKKLERAERMMVGHMCRVTLRDMKSSEELGQRLGVESVTEVVGGGRAGVIWSCGAWGRR